MTKVGRNSPCPCGSGNKYKRCCIDRPVLEGAAKYKLIKRIMSECKVSEAEARVALLKTGYAGV